MLASIGGSTRDRAPGLQKRARTSDLAHAGIFKTFSPSSRGLWRLCEILSCCILKCQSQPQARNLPRHVLCFYGQYTKWCR